MQYQNEEYNKIFERLPEPIQDVVRSYDTTKKMWAIGQKYKLHIDQIGVLNDIILDVAMGIIASKDFVDEIVKEVKVSKLDASAIVHDVDEEIFKPVKELMIKTYADGAPFKPKTLQTTREGEDHADALSPDELLRSIENPDPLVVRKINNSNRVEAIVTFDQKPIETSPTKPVFVTETEPNLNISEDLKQKRARILNAISSTELDSIITMSKTESRGTPNNNPQIPINIPKPIAQELKSTVLPISSNFPEKTMSPIKKEVFETKVIPETKPVSIPTQTPTQEIPKPPSPKIPIKEKTFANIVDPYRKL